MKLDLRFEKEKETKGAVRYQEIDPDGKPAFAPQIGSLYIRKSAMVGGVVPERLVVTVEG